MKLITLITLAAALCAGCMVPTTADVDADPQRVYDTPALTSDVQPRAALAQAPQLNIGPVVSSVCIESCSRSVDNACQAWGDVFECIDACEADVAGTCTAGEMQDMREWCVPLWSNSCDGALYCMSRFACQGTFQ